MKMTKLIIIFLISIISNSLYAQSIKIGIQSDLMDLAANGFTIGLNVQINKNRIFLVGGRNELPDLLNPLSEDFREERTYLVHAGYIRFFNEDATGWFTGLELIYQNMAIHSKTDNERMTMGVLRTSPLLGYEWQPFSKVPLSIAPWMSLRIPLISQTLDFPLTNLSYQTQTFNFVMGMNLIYKI